MASTIETHPQYQQMIAWLDSGLDPATVAHRMQPPVHRTTVWRFQRNQRLKLAKAAAIPSIVVSALEQKGLLKDGIENREIAQTIADAAQLQLSADPIRARILAHQSTLDAAIQDARVDKDARGIAALIGTDLRGLELDARLTGRLDAAPAGTSSTFVLVPIAVPGPPAALPQPAQDVEWSEVKPEDSNT